MSGGTTARNVLSLIDHLGGFPPGFDDSGMVTGTSKIHSGAESIAAGFVRAEERVLQSPDIRGDLFQLTGHSGVFVDLRSPVSSHFVNSLNREVRLILDVLVEEVDQLLRRLLRKAEFLKDRRGLINHCLVEFATFGRSEGVGVWRLRRLGRLRRLR